MPRKLGKNKKKSWRKGIDISEVEQKLEDERLMERIGPVPDEVFVIEKTGSTTFDRPTRSKATIPPKQIDGIKKLRTTADLTKDLSAHRGLKSDSKVKPAIKARPGPKQKPLKLKSGSFTPAKKSDKLTFDVDIWNHAKQDENDINVLKTQQEFLRSKKTKTTPSSIFTKPNMVPALEVAHPGSSYNPAISDYNHLVSTVVDKELKLVKEDEKLQEDASVMKTPQQIEKEYLKEMIQGLDDEDEGCLTDEDNEEEESDHPKTKTSSVVWKTNAQRNREKRVKMMERRREREKALERANKNPLSIKRLLKEVRQEEQEIEKKKKVKEGKERRRLLVGRKRLGRIKLPSKEEVVPLPTDLKGSLRKVKVEGNLLKERFDSLIRRNIIEPRIKSIKHRNRNKEKPKKAFLKRSHQEAEK